MSIDSDVSKRSFLRHMAATLAYRGGKVLRDAPRDFSTFKVGETSRSPSAILSHVCDLLDWELALAQGQQVFHETTAGTWDEDVARFFSALQRLEAFLASDQPLAASPEQLFQGPVADAFTHIGQLAMLRRLAGLPIRGENYFKADIAAGRVGREQTAPRREFD